MNPLEHMDLNAAAAFGALSLGAFTGLVLLSGHFPAAQRPERLRRPFAQAVIAAGAAVAIGLAALAAVAALRLPWNVAVVLGGGAALLAPFVVQPLPERMRDSLLGVAAFLLLGIAALAVAPAALDL